MSNIKEVFRVVKDFLTLLPMMLTYKPPEDDENISLGSVFQATALKYSDKTALIFEDQELNWRDFNRLVNQYAHTFKSLDIRRRSTVALYMENRIEFLACLVGLNKIGATAALINNSLTGRQLVHCIKVADSIKCIFGEELGVNILAAQKELNLQPEDYLFVQDKAVSLAGNTHTGNTDTLRATDELLTSGALNLSELIVNKPQNDPPETKDIKAGEKAMYIYTSGTTGLPKPAILYHRRFLAAAFPYAKLGLRAKAADRIYLCLPLYHITALGPGFGSSITSGASIFLRRKFSAHNFWREVQNYQTNLFVYVGELCRYLSLHPQCPEEKNNPIQAMLGNGLRPDIWDQFRYRFSVSRITEIYGSSEGNAVFFNFLNKDHTIGITTGKIMLAKYDIDNDELVKDKNGRLIEVKNGEPGLLLAKIFGRYKFDGYKQKDASNSKVMENVQEEGDRWFNTGDMIRQIDVGFSMGMPHYQFVDRIGDTFRWRSENVSTNEVGEILNRFHQVKVANVFGVPIPGAEGKAGMAAITLDAPDKFDVEAFSKYVNEQLPAYARPVFLRIQPELETTGTFKLVKGQLRKEAYHLEQIRDPIYVMRPRSDSYEVLGEEFYQKLTLGEAGF